jgi:MoxR-like ATPase
MFKLIVPYSNRKELAMIIDRTTADDNPEASEVLNAKSIIAAQHLVRRVAVAEHVQDYAIRLVLATHPEGEFAIDITNQYVRFGASPRGAQSIMLAAKVRALLDERYHISFSDVRESCLAALRHRVLLNFEAQAEGISNDEIIKQIISEVPTTMEKVSG